MPKLAAKFEDWTWPWTKGEVDEEKAARLIYQLKQERESLQESKTSLTAQVETLTEEKATLTDKVAAAGSNDSEKDAEIATLKKANRELTGQVGKSLPKDQLTIAKLELALDNGFTKTQARRLVGETQEELEADAEELKKDLGLDKTDDSGSGGDDQGSGFGSQNGMIVTGDRLRTGTHQIGSQQYETDPGKIKLPSLT